MRLKATVTLRTNCEPTEWWNRNGVRTCVDPVGAAVSGGCLFFIMCTGNAWCHNWVWRCQRLSETILASDSTEILSCYLIIKLSMFTFFDCVAFSVIPVWRNWRNECLWQPWRSSCWKYLYKSKFKLFVWWQHVPCLLISCFLFTVHIFKLWHNFMNILPVHLIIWSNHVIACLPYSKRCTLKLSGTASFHFCLSSYIGALVLSMQIILHLLFVLLIALLLHWDWRKTLLVCFCTHCPQEAWLGI